MELVPSITFYKINGISRIAAIVTIVIISHLTSIPTGLSVPSIETLTPNANISIKNNVYNINANDNLPILCNGIDFWHKI